MHHPQQPATTDVSIDETTIGVPNQLCSVCGDASTGETNISSTFVKILSSSFVPKAFISVATVAKVAKHFFVVRFNVIVIRIINVRTKVCSLDSSIRSSAYRSLSTSLERCPVNIVTRKVCQFCRYHKCTKIGMKPKW